MIDAWFKESEMIASFSPNKGSNTPPFASKAAAYKIVSSVPKNVEIFSYNVLLIYCVPQIKRTEDNPNPWLSIAAFAASITFGCDDKPK